VAHQELGGRAQHFFGFLALVGLNRFLADHAARTRRQLGLHRQQGEAVAGREQLLVGDQIGQHFLGVGTAVDSEQDFHGHIS
jgi:hypothetical protein